ncbi:outer membrane protein assembly factor BamE precursor [mine drainage metagenome]|uniref:Outer membrane protein assembly factor BamE n=1 Tax=mine drainage metagenome TaxID=410659 RepID=A0A1J5P3X3_9ZZZZ
MMVLWLQSGGVLGARLKRCQYNASIISFPARPMFHPLARCVWLSVLGITTLSACGSFDSASNRLANIIPSYKMDIVQGNFVSREQADAIKPGMSRIQVKNILGTPLLVDIFHADRWDYVFTFKRQGAQPQDRRVTVFFKGDVLERIKADDLPSEAEFVASLDSGRKSGPVPVLEMSEEALKATAKPDVPVPAKPVPALPASYPPLEAAPR